MNNRTIIKFNNKYFGELANKKHKDFYEQYLAEQEKQKQSFREPSVPSEPLEPINTTPIPIASSAGVGKAKVITNTPKVIQISLFRADGRHDEGAVRYVPRRTGQACTQSANGGGIYD